MARLAWLPATCKDPNQLVQAARLAQKALHRNAPGLARVLGAEEPTFVAALQAVPPHSEPLLLQMLYALTGDQPPPLVCSTKGCPTRACVDVWAPTAAVRSVEDRLHISRPQLRVECLGFRVERGGTVYL